MISTQPPAGFFSQLARPFTGEELYDCLGDLVFFIKNIRGEYVVVNQALVERCGRRDKNELIGRWVPPSHNCLSGERYSSTLLRVLYDGHPLLLVLYFQP